MNSAIFLLLEHWFAYSSCQNWIGGIHPIPKNVKPFKQTLIQIPCFDTEGTKPQEVFIGSLKRFCMFLAHEFMACRHASGKSSKSSTISCRTQMHLLTGAPKISSKNHPHRDWLLPGGGWPECAADMHFCATKCCKVEIGILDEAMLKMPPVQSNFYKLQYLLQYLYEYHRFFGGVEGK